MSTIKQVYNARYMYKKSVRGDRTEMQQLMMLLERDMYVHWSRFEEGTNVLKMVAAPSRHVFDEDFYVQFLYILVLP